MRFSFVDFALMTVILGAAQAVFIWIYRLLHLQKSILAGLMWILILGVVYLLASSPLYRRLHLYAMLLPRCPVCRGRDRHYYTVSREWPVEVVECAICHSRIELRHADAPLPERQPDLCCFELLWPYSWGGRWRRRNATVAHVDNAGHGIYNEQCEEDH